MIPKCFLTLGASLIAAAFVLGMWPAPTLASNPMCIMGTYGCAGAGSCPQGQTCVKEKDSNNNCCCSPSTGCVPA